MVRSDPTAEAAPADCRAKSMRGSAISDNTEITPTTNNRSTSANPRVPAVVYLAPAVLGAAFGSGLFTAIWLLVGVRCRRRAVTLCL
jgi:hypothetical protein